MYPCLVDVICEFVWDVVLINCSLVRFVQFQYIELESSWVLKWNLAQKQNRKWVKNSRHRTFLFGNMRTKWTKRYWVLLEISDDVIDPPTLCWCFIENCKNYRASQEFQCGHMFVQWQTCNALIFPSSNSQLAQCKPKSKSSILQIIPIINYQIWWRKSILVKPSQHVSTFAGIKGNTEGTWIGVTHSRGVPRIHNY